MTPKVDELYAEALGYLDGWELDQAEECLLRLIELDPDTPAPITSWGLSLPRQDLRQAEDCFNRRCLD